MDDPKYRDEDWLRKQYLENGRTMRDIGDECGVTHGTVRHWIVKFDIPRRNRAGRDEHTPEERFWGKVDRGDEDECWEWHGARTTDGYGIFTIDRDDIRAHRYSMEIHDYELGEKQVNHHCDNKPCVNPAHLYVGTQTENMEDAWERIDIDPPGHPGESNPNSKLSESDVREIRDRYADGEVTQTALANEYGVSQFAIGTIVRRETWVEVGGGE